MTRKLEGKVAVVTGGSSGIGFATAQRLAAEGAKVVITGRRQPELDSAVKEIGGDAIGVRGDVANLADLDRLYATVKEKHGRVDVLFANAGGGEFAPLGQITEEHFDKTFDGNVKGLLFSVQKALPLMPDGASIILNASIVSIKGMESFSVYSATKAAVRSFARTWTTDLKARKIRVNTLSPGPVETEGFHSMGALGDEMKKTVLPRVALGRMGQPADIAKVAVFFASDDAAWVTGESLNVSGGFS